MEPNVALKLVSSSPHKSNEKYSFQSSNMVIFRWHAYFPIQLSAKLKIITFQYAESQLNLRDGFGNSIPFKQTSPTRSSLRYCLSRDFILRNLYIVRSNLICIFWALLWACSTGHDFSVHTWISQSNWRDNHCLGRVNVAILDPPCFQNLLTLNEVGG